MSDVKQIIEQGDKLFSKKSSVLTLWQDIAEHFYPERADFTLNRDISDNFADYLMNAYPVLVRRELGNAFSSILRPTETDWFYMLPTTGQLDNQGRRWLERVTDIQKRAMYDINSQFQRATKEGDQDFATFGQCVISIELNATRTGLLYRCWHLRDVAWCENSEGRVNTIHRKWKPYASQLVEFFGKKVHDKVRECITKKEGYTEINCRHVVLPTSEYSDKKYKTPYISYYIDVDNNHIMEEVGVYQLGYVVPRWQTVSGSQYAHSPATIISIADARMLQTMTRVLLEAGEKAVNPAILARQNLFREDYANYPGGLTWADLEGDEKIQDAIQVMEMDKSGIPAGLNMHDIVQNRIAESFFINKLQLPPSEREMTAFEIGHRVQEYVRQAMPLFEPVEVEYNGSLCNMTFDLMFRNGAFGSMRDIPESLSGQNIEFRFESPLHMSSDRQKVQKFREGVELSLFAGQVDPTAALTMDIHTGLRDSLYGNNIPATWILPEEVVAQKIQAQQEAQAAQQELQQADQMAAVMEKGGRAVQSLNG